MTKNMVKERRKVPRIDTRLALQVERNSRPPAERPLTTESINLSSGGLCATVRSQVEPLTKVGLTMLLPSFGRKGKKTQVVSCGGVVVRCHLQPGGEEFDLACAFTDVKKEDKLLIEEYIGWRLMQDLVDERLSQP
jgi:c-di-GMP-binding flagellar brake protein YcgR